MKPEIGMQVANNYSKEQVVGWLKEYGLHHFLQYTYTPSKGMSVGHMVRYPEDLAAFIVEKLNGELNNA